MLSVARGGTATKPACLFPVLALMLVFPASGQLLVTSTDATGRTVQTIAPDPSLVLSVTMGDSLAIQAAFDPNEIVHLIIQFESPPYSLIKAQHTGPGKAFRLAAAAADMQRERRQFRADLAALDGAAKQGDPLKPAATRLRFDYTTTFNGMALTTRRWATQAIGAFPSVRQVYVDGPLHALNRESHPALALDRVRSRLQASGAGVTIAILDTGIDYSHPDLGGGFGPGFKVAGGYDFIDDDADPMDEHGHGTHVAGIAAADGTTVRGVAPNARLLAVRVLDERGQGRSSAALAGIEFAVDPDGDPATDDHADVINVSLGGPGSPTDPLSQAINAAVESGVVCVAAAGNKGSYQAIQSPGTASGAITVGASDLDDSLAPFSSRGPTDLAFTNKPDVVAPGVDILSTFPGNAYRTLTGTSMAAPHVAGAAALLLEQHPDWKPALVKAALVQSAADIGQDIWTQGGGRVDTPAAAQLPLVVTPSTMSLGVLDLTHPTHTHTETLTLHNLSDQVQSFDLSIEGTLPPGVVATLTPNRVTLAPGEQGTALFSAVINTAQVPFAPIAPPPFVGRVLVQSPVQSVVVPFTFLKTPHLSLTFEDGPPLYLLIHDGQRYGRLLLMDMLWGADPVILPLHEGRYEVIGVFIPLNPDPPRFPVTFDVREQVPVSHTTKANLTWKQGENTILYRLIDVDGNTMDPDYTFARLVFEGEAFTLGVGGTLKYDHLRIENVSERYRLNMAFHTFSHPSGADYIIPFSLGPGITSSENVRNDPSTFKRSDSRFTVGPGIRELMIVQGNYYTVLTDFPIRSFFFSPSLIEHHRLAPPFQRTVYYRPIRAPGSAYRFQSYQVFDTTTEDAPVTTGIASNQLYESVLLEITPDKVIGRRSLDPESILFSANKTVEEVMGVPPPYWMARFSNAETGPINRSGAAIHLERAPLAPLFANPGGDLPPGPVAVQVFAGGRLVTDGALPNEPSPVALTLRNQSTQTSYETRFAFDGYEIQGVKGRAAARLRFRLPETAAYDANPPTFETFQLTSDGAFTNHFLPATDHRITFTLKDVDAENRLVPVASAALFYHRLGDLSIWEPLSISRSGDTFTATTLPDLLDGFYALRVLATDRNGNALDYIAEPAFRYGMRTLEENTPPTAFALLSPPRDTLLDRNAPPAPIRFAWEPSADADGDLLRYTFRLSGPGLDTTLTVGDQTSLRLDLASRLDEGAVYTWTTHVADGFAVIPATESFSLRTPGVATSVAEAPGIPRDVALLQNFPNPFLHATTITFALPESGQVHLDVFDLLGRKVAALVDGMLPAGRHRIVWEAADVPSGVYLYRLTTSHVSHVQRMIRIR
ncbi:MAG: S8 family serine peptidase [Rhodothermales bacterium]